MKEYFSHDYNARNDKKLTRVLMKHGVSGIGIYWCVVEMLFEESGFLKLEDYERITFELRTDYETIKSVVEDFDLFENDGEKFWSESAIHRLKERMNRSEKARASVMKRWNKAKSDTNVLQTKNDSNTSKVKESKEKETFIEVVYFDKSPEIDSAFKDYLKLRKVHKYTMTERAINALVKKLRELSGGDVKKALDIIDNAILGKWKSFYTGDK